MKSYKKLFKRITIPVIGLVMIIASSLTVHAAPRAYQWIWGSPKFYSENGNLAYIQQHGLNSYVNINELNVEQFLIDNPDFITANITERDQIWNWLVTFDSVSPRKFHSLNPYDEYYCRARNLCIDLGVYGPNSTLSVQEKCRRIHDEVCYRCDYDFTFSRYGYEDIMDDNLGVCNAYATYGAMMYTIAGVESGYVLGPNHIWNAVLAEDGIWYQTDLCWDACYGYSLDYFWMYERCNVAAYNVSSSGVFMTPTEQDIFITQDLR